MPPFSARPGTEPVALKRAQHLQQPFCRLQVDGGRRIQPVQLLGFGTSPLQQLHQ